jgi:hypothetical protein
VEDHALAHRHAGEDRCRIASMNKHLPSDDLDRVNPDVRRLARRCLWAEVDAVPGGSWPGDPAPGRGSASSGASG